MICPPSPQGRGGKAPKGAPPFIKSVLKQAPGCAALMPLQSNPTSSNSHQTNGSSVALITKHLMITHIICISFLDYLPWNAVDDSSLLHHGKSTQGERYEQQEICNCYRAFYLVRASIGIKRRPQPRPAGRQCPHLQPDFRQHQP